MFGVSKINLYFQDWEVPDPVQTMIFSSWLKNLKGKPHTFLQVDGDHTVSCLRFFQGFITCLGIGFTICKKEDKKKPVTIYLFNTLNKSNKSVLL